MLDFDDDGLGGLRGFGGSSFGGGVGNSRTAKAPLKVPVSILCGFLGAGKTTLVQHILRNREGLKVGVVVNDVAEANVDSEVLKIEDADGIIGLQNGCACCSGRDDLFARLQELVDSSGISKLDRRWDRLVVECSGVAEPESIARELEAMAARGEPVMRRVFLAGIICVVDASTFWDMYYSSEVPSSGRPLAELLLNQLESADTVIVNKADLVEEAALARLKELLKSLSPNARCLESTRGAVHLRTLLPADPIDLDMPAYVPSLTNRHNVAVRHATAACPSSEPASTAGEEPATGHEHGHGHAHSHSHEHGQDCSICMAADVATRHSRYGLTSFVYRCNDRLFQVSSLAAVIRQLPVVEADLQVPNAPEGDVCPHSTFAGVLRSKGFCRVAGCDTTFYWSHAGRRVQLSGVEGTSFRGQELVFIGSGMDQEAITRALEGALEGEAEARL